MEIVEPGSSVNAIQRERNENQAGECSGVNQNAETGKARLYKAAKDGNFDAFKDAKSVEQLVTPNRNSVLHIYITARPLPSKTTLILTIIREVFLLFASSKAPCRSANFVWQIVDLFPDLLRKTNVRDETPLHIAARHGHSDIVGVLISQFKNVELNNLENGAEKAREMLEMTNKDKDTALHEAVRGNHVDVVKKLVQEEPNIPYGPNKAGESALYLASVSGFKEVVKAILTSCTSPDPYGPKGRTALHEAVLRKNKGITNLILENEEKTKRLTNKADDRGWIPLHYAAYFGNLSIIERLLEADNSSVYEQTRFEKKTALHLAASRGKVEVLEKLISLHPDCCGLVDEREWNVIHFAVESKNEKTIEYVLSHPLLRNLIYQKNDAGNTPLHQLALSSPSMAEKSFTRHPEIRKPAFNDLDTILATEEKTCQQSSDVGRRERIIVEKDQIEEVKHKSSEFIKRNAKQGRDKFKDGNKDAGQTQLIVSTLVATVTFAAGFTLPGGYIGDDKINAGGAVLVEWPLFQAFLAVDAVALMISCCAALIRLFISWREEKEKRLLSRWALWFTYYGLLCMMVAFIAGVGVVVTTPRYASGPRPAGSIMSFIFIFIFPLGCSIVLCGIYIPTRMLCIEITKRIIGSKTKKED